MKTFPSPIIRGLLTFTLLALIQLTISFEEAEASDGVSFLESVKGANEPFDTDSVVQVQPIVEESVVAQEQYQGGAFRVLARKSKIERYPCSSCHTTQKAPLKSGAALTHGEIVVKHGSNGNELSCVDCHHPENRDYLEDKKGRKVDFDHSYQLCGQCHFRQKRDWSGGAHGKRVEYWAGERVVYNCATCHDPHSPKFDKRYPSIYSVPLN